MKKWMLCLAAFLAMSFLDLWPFRQQDAGNLYLVETLLVEADENGVTLSTEDLSGAGSTVDEALAALEEGAPGQLFLRQVKRVIFCGGAEAVCDPMALPDELPMGACVYRCAEGAAELDLEKLNPVLEAREARQERQPTLARLENAALEGTPPALTELEGSHADS